MEKNSKNCFTSCSILLSRSSSKLHWPIHMSHSNPKKISLKQIRRWVKLFCLSVLKVGGPVKMRWSSNVAPFKGKSPFSHQRKKPFFRSPIMERPLSQLTGHIRLYQQLPDLDCNLRYNQAWFPFQMDQNSFLTILMNCFLSLFQDRLFRTKIYFLGTILYHAYHSCSMDWYQLAHMGHIDSSSNTWKCTDGQKHTRGILMGFQV